MIRRSAKYQVCNIGQQQLNGQMRRELGRALYIPSVAPQGGVSTRPFLDSQGMLAVIFAGNVSPDAQKTLISLHKIAYL